MLIAVISLSYKGIIMYFNALIDIVMYVTLIHTYTLSLSER